MQNIHLVIGIVFGLVILISQPTAYLVAIKKAHRPRGSLEFTIAIVQGVILGLLIGLVLGAIAHMVAPISTFVALMLGFGAVWLFTHNMYSQTKCDDLR
jgi:flagellar biosynthesis protein FliR